MTINVYEVGDLARMEGTFRNVDGDLIDPSGVKVVYTKPNGVQDELVYGTDAELVRASLGVYHADVSVDVRGEWRYKWISTGSGQASAPGVFMVEGI